MFQFTILLLTAALLVGCASAPPIASAKEESPSRVQLLGFEGCPNTPVMRQRLVAALAQNRTGESVEWIDQEALAEDDLRRGWPAPTVLVDGDDLFGMSPPSLPSLGCRMYRGPGGVPSVDELARRLAAAGIGGNGP